MDTRPSIQSTIHIRKLQSRLPAPGAWHPVLNSDDPKYGGWGTELPAVHAEKSPWKDLPYSAEFTLPPLSVLFYKRGAPAKDPKV